MKTSPPAWQIPTNLRHSIDAYEDGTWEDNRWSPVLLTVMSGTSYAGRDIPLAWQIEFEPSGDAFDAANRKIADLGVDPDGYGWSEVLKSVISRHHPEIVEELHFDSEASTCVVWVESEDTCRLLMQVAWSLIHGSGPDPPPAA
jgi:hypothetical protein